MSAVTRESIASAEKILRPYIRRTPVIEIAAEDFGLSGAPIALKLEFMQRAGSFKTRGAFTNLLTRDVPKAGVAAASGGNHGAAVAYAAQTLNTPARIFVPAISSPAKIERIRGYGADLVVGGERYADALAACEAWMVETGAMGVHAFDDDGTLIGQGTVALELEQQLPKLDTVLVAVGGGGLIGGIAACYGTRVHVVAVEPELAPTLHMALEAGVPVDAPAGGIAADSLAPKRIGERAFATCRANKVKSVLVADDAIRAAQKAAWATARIAAEPGGCAALAALLSGRYVPQAGERVGVVMSGANTTVVDFDR